jgi:hypothetical protein
MVLTNSAAVHFEAGGEAFHRSSDFGDWLGFYDWLRTQRGLLVGVRLRPDSPEILRLVEPFMGPFVVIGDDGVTIRTSVDDVIAEAKSDDADFGGNSVFLGNEGSLAIKFFCPPEWA